MVEAAAVRQWAQMRGPRVAAIFLGGLIVLDCLSFGLRFWPWRATEILLQHPDQAPAIVPFGSLREASVARILAAHLFGNAPAAVQMEVAAPQDLKLRGTFASPDGHSGYAIIGTGTGAMHLYAVGSQLTPGSTLSAVYPDHVVIVHDNATSVLRLAHFPQLDAPQRRQAPQEQLALNGSEQPATTSDTDHSFDPPPMPASGAIIHSLNLLPAMDHGRRVGMRVGTSQDGAKVRQILGFSSGDVVVALNGESIADQPGGAGALMRAINAEDTVTLTVERQGQPVTITIDPNHAGAAASAFNNSL